ncbi:MAG: uracil-DNA glycosylase family protein [Gammaproteobacteria bacterium]
MNSTRRACLDAMGIDVYVRRGPGFPAQAGAEDNTDHAPIQDARRDARDASPAARPKPSGRQAALDGIRDVLGSHAARPGAPADSRPDARAALAGHTADGRGDGRPSQPPVDQLPTQAPPGERRALTPGARSASPGSDPGATAEQGVGCLEWIPLRERVSGCSACSELASSRTQTVFGVGNRRARLMVIGEAPGRDEDARGEPFVGRAGQLLDRMLQAMGFARDDVYIANILKCRPPNNRDPSQAEAAACRAYLDRQIALVSPKVILSVGRISAQNLLHTDRPVGRMRGIVHELEPSGIPVVVTYHPAYLLRQPSEKRKAWSDLQQAMALLGEGA